MRRVALIASLVVLAACTSTSSTEIAPSSSTPTSNQVVYTTKIIGSLPSVVDLVERLPEDNWLYVVSRNGTVERWSRDGSRIDSVLDISSQTSGEGERGLLGLIFRHTKQTTEAFINYTDRNGDTVVSQLSVKSDGTFDTSQSITGKTILTIEQPYANHNGGGLAIGPDNFLYIGTGDGGSANDPERRALDTSSLLGKILRIDPKNSDDVGGTGYNIPSDNPYISTKGARPEIWSIGVRNPWRFTFDTYGNMWIADVGQNAWEEVSVATGSLTQGGGRGVSFGWSAYEGTHRFNPDVSSPNSIQPIYEYPHEDGACSISGGALGTNVSALGRAGWYFFGDFCTGTVTAILTNGTATVASETVATQLGNISAVRATSTALYVLSFDGAVRQLTVARKN